jgi:predicted alpha/beta superfamily hydrolase
VLGLQKTDFAMRSFLAGAALLLLGSALAAPASTLTVTVLYPANQLGGQGLYIRGNATALSWSVGLELTPVATDEYAISLPLSSGDAAGPLAVKLLVADETWQVGANELIAIPSPAGNFSYTAYPWFGSQPGRYETVDGLYSPQLNNTRGLCVYLPPSYDENPYKPFYPEDVLWMHDGQNLFNESTAPFGAWMIQDTLDPMITNALMREIIVVGVDNTDQRTYEYTYSVDPTVGVGGGADLYLDFLEQNVLPFVLTRYRISATGRTRVAAAATPTGATRAATGRAGAELAATGCEEGLSRWGMLGSSLGGLLSCYAAWTRPDMWGAFAGCMSSSFWWNSEDFNNTIMQRHAGG